MRGRFAVFGPPSLEAHYVAAAPQKDHLCGAFWGALALRAHGLTSVAGEELDQDLVARESGTTLEHGDPYASLPPRAQPRLDYRIELQVADDPRTSGTAAPALAAAIARAAGGAVAVVPIAGRWTGDAVRDLLAALAELRAAETVLIANLQTRHLWGTATPPERLLAYLGGADVGGAPPDWSVGHFVNLAFVVTSGPRSVVGVRDTYPSLGWNGLHLQPADALASALERDDGNEGGVLCVAPPAVAAGIEAAARAAGLEVRDWDNGSVAVGGGS